ncbi:stage III sporulation protein AG [Salibacterium halotolerans]|uniref:Stage III sporulation protein AG n=1 Tax=Salibacterium halotolerans TaxID=1884432 RepID=A0A1I5NNQ5_9BACI|nr:stage III sporulation protein AG [Salibacterium halotolerans]SFP23280.1 stage III sporulation protein AG [Salibacterium halotolerans]
MPDNKTITPVKKLKQWLGSGQDTPSRKSFPLYLGLLLLAGIIFMATGAFHNDGEQGESPAGSPAEREEIEKENSSGAKRREIETEMQKRLKSMLENIAGVENVTVMLNLEGTEKKVYEKDRTISQQTTNEEDQEGGTRVQEEGTTEEQTVIIQQDGEESPLLLYKEKPEAKGVLVVADGVEDLEVKEWVVEAVTRVLDVAPHKVSVLPDDQMEGE